MFNKTEKQKISQIPLSDILPCPYQPRKVMKEAALTALAQNITENGILQPLTATKLPNGKYQLIAGHRRLLAADMAGLSTVPVLVLDKTQEEIAVLTVIENLQREDLNFFEQSAAIQMLMEQLNLTQVQVGKKLSLSQPAIANKLRILQFTPEQQKKIISANLTERHARRIIRLPEQRRTAAIEHVIKNNLNVSQTDRYIDGVLAAQPRKRKKTSIMIKDLRLFTNTITKRVKIMQTAGINANFTQNEDEKYINYFISVPKIAKH